MLFGAACVIAALRIYVGVGEDSRGYNWLLLVSIAQIAPFLLGLILKSQNYLNFILASHFVGFSVTKFNEIENLSKTKALSLGWILASRELLICTLCMIVSYHLACRVFVPAELRKRKFNDLTLQPGHLRWIMLYICLIPWIPNLLPSSLVIIHFAMASAQILLVICADCPKNPRMIFWARLAIPMVSMVGFLSNGFLTMFGNYASFLFVYSFLHNRKKYFIAILAFTVFLSMLQNIKHPYRTFLSLEMGENSGYVERLGYLFQLFSLKYIDPDADETGVFEKEESSGQSVLRGFNRVGDDSLERVLAMTPSVVPFWNGDTYNSIPYMFIPRALWADKPGRNFWNKFGRTYSVLSSDDFQTSVGVGFLAEAYMNFGFGFMYLVAGGMGILIAGVELLSFTILRDKFYFPYISLMGPLIGLGADLGSILNSTVILSCCFFVARPFLLRMARRDDYS